MLMSKHIKSLLLLIGVLILAIHPVSQGQDSADPIQKRSSSLITLSANGDFLASVNPDSNSVSILSVESGIELLAEIDVGENPSTVTIAPDNDTVYVTSFNNDALSTFSIQAAISGQIGISSISVGNEPYGVIVDPTGTHIYVAESGSGTVAVFESAGLSLVTRVEVGGNPRGLAITEAGDRLYVTDFFTGVLSVVDTELLEVVNTIDLHPESNISLTVILDGTEDFAFVPVTRSNVDNKALTFETTVFPSVSIVDLNSNEELSDFRMNLHIIDEPVSMPIDAVVDNQGRIFILNASSNDISVINLASFESEAHIPTGEHPRGIAISQDGARIFINNTLDGTIRVTDTETFAVLDEIAVTNIPLEEEILLGKILFNSANRPDLAKNQWISCAICHFDGGHDGRTWFFDDGPRNTPSMFGVSETAPFHWSGDLDELADVESTIRNIQLGTGLVDLEMICEPTCDQSEPLSGLSDELDALVAYIETLSLASNPNLSAEPDYLASVERGEAVFLAQETGCASCHNAPLYTDLMRHDVGTATSELETKGSEFDTPSLRGIYSTAPYLHDGSAATLQDVITTNNPEDLHGTTSQLTDEEIEDLIQFLLSL